MTPSYPPSIALTPVSGPLTGVCRVPGSKSITNRALVLAALSSRRTACRLTGVLHSEDTAVMVESLRRLGFEINEDGTTLTLDRSLSPRIIPAERAELDVANSGTSMRFLTAMLALGEGEYRLDGVARMRERPIGDLIDALRLLGVDCEAMSANACPPVVMRPTGLKGGTSRIRADVSSQFLSGLMMAAPFAEAPITLRREGEVVSEPYLVMTNMMLRRWGCPAAIGDGPWIRLDPAHSPGTPEYAIEPDASAASYFLAAAAVTGGRVTVPGLGRHSLQGDAAFADALARMGCCVEYGSEGITVEGGRLSGIDIDMNAISDTAMTLAAVACFADGPTRIRRIAHVRHKETDRISATATELRKFGVGVQEFDDGLEITPAPMRGAEIDTYNDHRMAMSMALVGLRVPGVVIRDPGCVAKTYPGFWDDWAALTGRPHN